MKLEMPRKKIKHDSPHQQKFQAPAAGSMLVYHPIVFKCRSSTIPGNREDMIILIGTSHYHQSWSF